MEENTLIITSSVKANAADVLLTDSNDRLTQTLSAIEKIVELNLFKRIYICDGSDYNFSEQLNQLKLKNKGKTEINFLCFQQSIVEVKKFGKSYGEILIYEKLIELLKKDNIKEFYKLSGRWSVDNIESIVDKTKHFNNFFYTFYPRYCLLRPYVHTAFYKSSTELLAYLIKHSKTNIQQTHEIALERVFYGMLKNKKKHWLSLPYPKYSGYSGTKGQKMDESKIKTLEKKVLSSFSQYAFTVK